MGTLLTKGVRGHQQSQKLWSGANIYKILVLKEDFLSSFKE